MRKVIKKVQQWAIDRALKDADPFRQLDKFEEEYVELHFAVIKKDRAETIDAIGDLQVVLIILCMQLGLDYDKCLESAYNEIKDRTGKTIDGIFVKDE